MFNALLIENDQTESTEQSGYRCHLKTLEESQLPSGDVKVEVAYSTLNYKDALAITGQGAVVRQFPIIPGIDFAGRVIDSQHPDYQVGDEVIANGWGLGEQYWGGLSQKASVSGDWLVPLPQGLDSRQAMGIGTAGYTAALCVQALEQHGLTPQQGEILVTGANGGVGSIAIALLAKAGYTVVAATGRPELADALKTLGAAEIIERQKLSEPGKPLARERWAGVVDSVGSHTLANACASTRADGAVAACGLAQGMDFPATVAPFILRGISLLGINSVTRPKADRIAAWQRLSQDLDLPLLESLCQEISLSDAIPLAERLLSGQVRGRLIVDVNR